MISKELYKEMEEKFGAVSSWAVWSGPYEAGKFGTGDMSIFENENLLDILHTNYVLVGMNVSGTHTRGDGYKGPWGNFHSDDNKKQQDYKLRYALHDTPVWGAYITDLIKNYPMLSSSDVKKEIKNDPSILKTNIESFKKELEMFNEKPVLIALGGDVYNYLRSELSDEYEIKNILHYSYYIGPEKYKLRVHEDLGFK